MKTKTIWLNLIIFSAVTTATFFSGCGTTGNTKTPFGKPVLRVGVTPNYPPLVFKKSKTLQGIEVDLAGDLGKETKKRIRFEEMAFGELIPALMSGKIDVIMSGMSMTYDRQQHVQFTQPYLQVGQMVIIRKADVGLLGNPSNLNRDNLSVGFEANTTGADFVKGRLKQAKAVPLSSAEEGLESLRNNTIDVFIHDAPTAWQLAENISEDKLIAVYRPLTEEYLAWAVRKDDEELRDELDRFISKWKQNRKLQTILSKWIKVAIFVN